MRLKRKRCPYCRDRFIPNPRLGGRQISCGKAGCKRQHALKCKRGWKRRNKKISKESDQDFRRNNKDYYKNYRLNHPKYTDRNRKQTNYRKRLKKAGLQSRIDIVYLFESNDGFGKFFSLQSRIDSQSSDIFLKDRKDFLRRINYESYK